MGGYLLLIVSAALVNNFVLTRFLGICPFLGVSKDLPTALGMSGAVAFVVTGAAAVTWLAHRWILVPLNAEYLQTIAFILLIATFVQFVEMVIRKTSPGMQKSLGIYLPLITTNCAVLGVTVLNVKNHLPFLSSVIFAFGAAVGFALALIIFTGLREKMNRANPPEVFKGTALALVTAGLLSLAFMGFSGLVKM